jgi:hypothetical protein
VTDAMCVELVAGSAARPAKGVDALAAGKRVATVVASHFVFARSVLRLCLEETRVSLEQVDDPLCELVEDSARQGRTFEIYGPQTTPSPGIPCAGRA